MDFGPKPLAQPGAIRDTTPRGNRTKSRTNARETRNRTANSEWRFDQFENLDSERLMEKFPCSLNFYDEPPRCDIKLENMELLAMERLRFLRILERNSGMAKNKEWAETVVAQLRDQGLDSYIKLDEHKMDQRLQYCFENRSKDHFSHFILRLAYCRTDDLRRWFIAQEVEAFKLRCFLHNEDLSNFMKKNDLKFQEVDEVEKKAILKDLTDAVNSHKFGKEVVHEVGSLEFYKVHFTEALDLVRGRKVFIKNGFCYVPIGDLQHLLTYMFKSLLTHNVAMTAKILPNLDEDDRLIRMLSELDKRYTGDDYASANTDVIKPEQIKGLCSRGAFPLCMRSMQTTMDKTHHLKYKARLQYGLFLKGIGLSLEDAIRFFRGEFTQSHVDAEKFDKEYTYGIRYNYGKEGKKVNWAPWNCMRIIMESVGPGENHGCPYRHHDPNSLRELLVATGVEGTALSNIMTAAKEGHYQKACAMQFKAAHKGQELSTGITEHPNQYYQESVYGGPKSGTTPANAARANLKTEKAHIYAPNQN